MKILGWYSFIFTMLATIGCIVDDTKEAEERLLGVTLFLPILTYIKHTLF